MQWLRPGGWSAPMLAFVAAMIVGLAGGFLLRPPAPPAAPSSRFEDSAPEMPRWEVDDPRADMRRSTEAKRAVARQVVGGSYTLIEAAAAIRRIDRNSPHFKWDLFQLDFRGATDDERHCGEVIAWVEHVLSGTPEEAGEWTERLKDEIERRRNDGTLTLPADGDDSPP